MLNWIVWNETVFDIESVLTLNYIVQYKIVSDRSDFVMTDSLSIAVHAFAGRVSMSVSVDETLNYKKKYFMSICDWQEQRRV